MKFILFFTLISLKWDLSLQQDYCTLHAEHSACKSSKFGPFCDRPREMIPSESDKEMILRWHNSIREKVASGQETRGKDGTLPQASNMRKLVWNEELALIAQAWANNCIFDHDCRECRVTFDDQFNSVGQSLSFINTTGSLSSINFVSTIDGWYSKEVQNLPTDVISNFVSTALGEPVYGHYTQVIWAESSAVGCGGVIYQKGNSEETIVACNYGDSGNVLGLPVYEAGESCSECPSGTSCSGSLCA